MSATVISVENRKGGVGKTTTAVTLGVYLAKRVYPDKVVIVCVDPQGDAARALGIDPGGRCLSQLLLEEATYSDIIMSADLASIGGPARPNLYYLPASDRLSAAITQIQDNAAAMREIADRMTVAARKRQGLDKVEDLTDVFLNVMMPLKRSPKGPRYILVDCPPSLGPLQLGVHKFADWAIVPVEPGDQNVAMTIRHTNQIVEDLEAGATMRLLAVLPTNVQPHVNLHAAMLQQLYEAYAPQRVLADPVPRRTAVEQGPSLGGLVIFDHDPDGDAAEAYEKLAQRVLSLR